VRATWFWNNHHQGRSKPKYLKAKYAMPILDGG